MQPASLPPGLSYRDERGRAGMSSRQKLWWISVLYFAEGFPFGIAIDNLPV